MVESQRTLTKPQLYEGLIDRLGRALDAARTAGRLRDERPLELELRGLSQAELELIRTYLELNQHRASHGQASPPAQEPPRSAKVIWLKDLAAGRGPERSRSVRCK
ncbi:hypothetical protein PseBG33_4893 [Pseudomonas synxantha BG33R]|jgi:hypothetical protein|uniref:Uncharacterized protein n=1 Tax=Pseudomonas synxantha TaxID=47883 RepID=A0A5D3G6S5_9PSED|nr:MULTISPECIES: hypothetical protein [Pseudomonas]EIK72914.1 hypothetical protein PseBG33_4893 [Pseudomonas synxantha BG33R]KFF45690.1 hypothetical protein JH25_18370 [Pseudomonas sp. BRG-100]MCK3823994.1 hypothetical protein [Pseudomonas sp. W2Aug9]MCK3829442.1 hypothetical protein [Pseudomonas fluorescens]MCK3844666.1 hypothetical protein [Pseudomonas sp. W15Feb34]